MVKKLIEERVTPGISFYPVVKEHLDRYEYAKRFTYGKLVLDAACGTGYGSKILAENAKCVKGIDISKDAVNYANEHYSKENVSFIRGDVTELPFEDNSFDVIVSFETIEHIKNYNSFMNECSRVLKPEGFFVCSTPNKCFSSPDGRIENPFHIIEFSPSDFRLIMEKRFRNVEILGQNNVNVPKKLLFDSYFIIKNALGIKKAIFCKEENKEDLHYPITDFKNSFVMSAYMVAVCSGIK